MMFVVPPCPYERVKTPPRSQRAKVNVTVSDRLCWLTVVMFQTRSEYDRGVNTFSPEGR
jgi:hypothetical protein